MKQFGSYQVTGTLGQGGMGTVYEVRHPAFPRPLALKTLAPDCLDPELWLRFRREAELLAKLDLPGIVKIHTLQHHPPAPPYLVTDRVDGTPLDRWIAPDWRDAARVVRDLARTVAAVHARGILHRDLKPHNVILTPQGQPILLDFGIARGQHTDRLTRTGDRLGTPAYLPPEAVTGTPLTHPAVDVYGLGMILFHTLAGAPPFPQRLPDLFQAIRSKAPPWPDTVPHHLRALGDRALAKDPSARPTAAEFARDLDAALTQPPPSPRRRGLALAALTLSALTLLGAWSWQPAPPTPPPLPEPTPAPPTAEPAPSEPRPDPYAPWTVFFPHETLAALGTLGPSAIAFWGDDLVVCLSREDAAVYLLDLRDGSLRTFAELPLRSEVLAADPNPPHTLAVATPDGRVYCWDGPPGQTGPARLLWSADPDAPLAANADNDGDPRVLQTLTWLTDEQLLIAGEWTLATLVAPDGAETSVDLGGATRHLVHDGQGGAFGICKGIRHDDALVHWRPGGEVTLVYQHDTQLYAFDAARSGLVCGDSLGRVISQRPDDRVFWSFMDPTLDGSSRGLKPDLRLAHDGNASKVFISDRGLRLSYGLCEREAQRYDIRGWDPDQPDAPRWSIQVPYVHDAALSPSRRRLALSFLGGGLEVYEAP